MRFLTRNQRKYPILRARWRVKKHGDPIFYCIFIVHIMNVNQTKFPKKFDSRTISRDFIGDGCQYLTNNLEIHPSIITKPNNLN